MLGCTWLGSDATSLTKRAMAHHPVLDGVGRGPDEVGDDLGVADHRDVRGGHLEGVGGGSLELEAAECS